VVTINDIAKDSNVLAEEKCMILKLTGANFNMKIELNCDDDGFSAGL
jgi:hypothetical protein